MHITSNYLRHNGACCPGQDWFDKNFSSGRASLACVLTKLMEEKRITWCYWLLRNKLEDKNISIDYHNRHKTMSVQNRLADGRTHNMLITTLWGLIGSEMTSHGRCIDRDTAVEISCSDIEELFLQLQALLEK